MPVTVSGPPRGNPAAPQQSGPDDPVAKEQLDAAFERLRDVDYSWADSKQAAYSDDPMYVGSCQKSGLEWFRLQDAQVVQAISGPALDGGRSNGKTVTGRDGVGAICRAICA